MLSGRAVAVLGAACVISLTLNGCNVDCAVFVQKAIVLNPLNAKFAPEKKAAKQCGDQCNSACGLNVDINECPNCLDNKCGQRTCGMECSDLYPCAASAECPNCIDGTCSARKCGDKCDALKGCGNKSGNCGDCVANDGSGVIDLTQNQLKDGTCGAAPTPPPPAPTFKCSFEVSEECCTGLSLEEQPFMGDIILDGTGCTEKDAEAINEKAECVEVEMATCNNDGDLALWQGEDGKQCQVDMDLAAKPTDKGGPGCSDGKLPPHYGKECTVGFFTGLGYTKACSTTIWETLIECGSNHAMDCATQCMAGQTSPKCMKCVQDMMVAKCVPTFETQSGIDGCPEMDFGKVVYSVTGLFANARLSSSLAARSQVGIAVVAFAGFVGIVGAVIAIARRRRLPEGTQTLVEGHE